MKLSKDARAALAAATTNSGALEIREPATQEVESPPRRRFTRSRPSLSGTDAPPTTQSGMKRHRTESESVPLVPLDATARKVKKLQFVPLEEWYREPRDDRAGKEFYTLLQAAFFKAYEARGIQLSRHNVLDYRKLSCAAGRAQIEPHSHT